MKKLLFLLFLTAVSSVEAQVSFQVAKHFFPGQTIKKLSLSDDGSVWVIKGNDNRGVGLLSPSGIEQDYSATFDAFTPALFNDIAAYDQNQSFLGTQGDYMIRYQQGNFQHLGPTSHIYSANINSVSAITSPINAIGETFLIKNYNSYPTYVPFKKLIYATGDNLYAYSDSTLQNFYPLIDTNFIKSKYKIKFTLQQADIREWYVEEHSPVIVFDSICQNPHYFGIAQNFLNGGYNKALGNSNIGQSTIYSRPYPDSSFYNGNYNSALLTGIILNFNFYTYPLYFWGTDKGLISGDFSCENPYTTYLDGIKVNRIVQITPFASIMGVKLYNNPYLQNYILAGTDKGLYYGKIYSTLKNDTYQVFKSIPDLDGLIIYDIKVDYNCDNSFWVGTNQGLYEIYLKWTNPISFTEFNIPIKEKGNKAILDSIPICPNKPNTLYGAFYAYLPYNFNNIALQWFKNDVPISGAISDTITTNLPGKYYMTTSSICDGVTIDTSKTVFLYVAPPPKVSLPYPSLIKICSDSVLTLQAYGDKNQHFQWYKNQKLIPGDTLNYLTIRDSTGLYSVSASNCSDDMVMSQSVSVHYIQVPKPLLTADNPIYCSGDTAHLSLNISSGYTIKWFNHEKEIPSFLNKTKISTQDSGYYTVQVSDTSFSCIQTSPGYRLHFNPIPKIYFQITQPDSSLCFGQSIELKAIPVSPQPTIHYAWSTGSTSSSISVNHSGSYSVEAYLSPNCSFKKDTTLTFLDPKPFSLGKDTTICFNDLISGTYIIQGPLGYQHYSWNHLLTNQAYYAIKEAGTYTLTATGPNGCPFSSQITITNYCTPRPLIFPTLFTPDGNGLNDVFSIQNIESYPDNEVHIFNRYGNEIYTTKGYGVNQKYWTGQGMPEGTYYYVLKVFGIDNGEKNFKGFITLMRSVQ